MKSVEDIIIDAVDNRFKVLADRLQFDKTYYGKVVSIAGRYAIVNINGVEYKAQIKDGILIGNDDIAVLKAPNGNFSFLYVDGKLGETAKADKMDILATPTTSYRLINQSSYEAGGEYYINFEVRKSDDGLFGAGFHHVANMPLTLDIRYNISLSGTCLNADGAPLTSYNGILEQWGTRRILLNVADQNTKIIIITGKCRKG